MQKSKDIQTFNLLLSMLNFCCNFSVTFGSTLAYCIPAAILSEQSVITLIQCMHGLHTYILCEGYLKPQVCIEPNI